MPSIGVIVAVRGDHEGRVVEAIEARPDLAVVRRCADLAEALGAAQAGIAMAVVVSPDPLLTRETLRDFAACGVAVLGQAEDPLDVEALRVLGVEVPDDIGEALSRMLRGGAPRAMAPLRAAAPTRSGVILAVWGTHGAPGRTTVAVNVSAELAALGHEALLVDLDTYAPSVATAFALEEESGGVAALAHGVARGLEAGALLERHAVGVRSRLRVLPGMVRASRWQDVSAASLDQMWPAVRAAADVTVVDIAPPVEDPSGFAMGARRDAATTAVLEVADAVIVVGSAEPRQLQRLIACLVDRPMADAFVAVNRIRPGRGGARPEHEIATLLGRLASVPEIWPLPWDPRACDEAERWGRTLEEAAPRSSLRRSLRALAQGAFDQARASHDAGGTQEPVGTPRGAATGIVPVPD